MIKICGITSAGDANLALSAGADWIGLNLVSGPRCLELTSCAEIIRALADPSRAVVLVRVGGRSVEDIHLSVLHDLGVRRLQLYGPESLAAVDAVAEAGFQTVLVHHVIGEASLRALSERLTSVRSHKPTFVLLDSMSPGFEGGSGTPADWKAIGRFRAAGGMRDWPPALLAGGLTALNVAEAVRITGCPGVDVSSGVESAPGRKDPAKVAAFIQSATDALQRLRTRKT